MSRAPPAEPFACRLRRRDASDNMCSESASCASSGHDTKSRALATAQARFARQLRMPTTSRNIREELRSHHRHRPSGVLMRSRQSEKHSPCVAPISPGGGQARSPRVAPMSPPPARGAQPPLPSHIVTFTPATPSLSPALKHVSSTTLDTLENDAWPTFGSICSDGFSTTALHLDKLSSTLANVDVYAHWNCTSLNPTLRRTQARRSRPLVWSVPAQCGATNRPTAQEQ